METLVINIDTVADANELVEKLNQLSYVKEIIWPNKESRYDHLMPGSPLSDTEIDELIAESESEQTFIGLSDARERLKNKFKNAWRSNSGKERI